MKIRIICVGRLKERYFADAEKEYVKRLSRFAQVEIVEVAEELPEGSSPADIKKAVDAEAERLLKASAGISYRIALSPEGRKTDSFGFAAIFPEAAVRGASAFDFFIGGSSGLGDAVKSRCDRLLSFSDLTFAHQLFRVILLEQIYRAFKINANETYHK
jgi:23S rRNA (pseudouridine1915-N3)-methyltransferase